MMAPEAVANSTTETFHEKLLAVQRACHELHLTPEATGQVQSRNYKYLTIGKLHDAVLPILHEARLCWTTQPTVIGDGYPGLNYTLSDVDSDELIDDTLSLIGCTDMQKLGSAITYARRYCLLAVLGLTPDEDDDGAAATQSASKATRAAVPMIPLDRAKKILEAAVEAGLADGTELKPALVAKLTEVGVETGKLGHLNVDQAEAIESFIAK